MIVGITKFPLALGLLPMMVMVLPTLLYKSSALVVACRMRINKSPKEDVGKIREWLKRRRAFISFIFL